MLILPYIAVVITSLFGVNVFVSLFLGVLLSGVIGLSYGKFGFEIHRLSPVVEEILYPALEDYQLDIMIGEGPAARSVKIDLPPFTLVGATTRAGMLTNPLRDRFGIVARLEFYQNQDLATIVSRSAQLLQLDMGEEGAMEVAKRSRGTPRIANQGFYPRASRSEASLFGYTRG